MKKISLLFLMLLMIFSSGVYAQDIVYLDFDRTGWTAEAPAYSPTDNAVGINGDVAGAKYLLDDIYTTFLALVKPGKSYGGIAGPDAITDLGFVVDMKSAQAFDFIRVPFRTDNSQTYLRPWKISLYGSNDAAKPTFTSGTWTPIPDAFGNTIIDIVGTDGVLLPGAGNIDVQNTTAYRYVKVVYEGMSSSSSGSTLQLAEFFAGKTTTDKVIVNPGDVTFGDVEVGATVTKVLGIDGYNLNNLSFSISGDGASAFSYVKHGTATSTKDSIVISFAPTTKKLYTAEMTITMTDVLEPQTITLTGNADFELPVQISNGTDHWYYIQFERQAVNAKVLDVDGSSVIQSDMSAADDAQLWKLTGTWDNYKIVNKTGNQLQYVHTPQVEGADGNIVPEKFSFETVAEGDAFGFVRYKETESWQLKDMSSTTIPAAKMYLSDNAGTETTVAANNNAGNQLRFISAAAASFVYPADTVAVGSTKKGQTGSFVVPVTGLNLSTGITVAKSEDNDNVFTLKTTSLTSVGGDIEIDFSPVAYKKRSYVTITLTSGSLTESFVVSATSDVGISKYYVGTEAQWGTRDDGEIVATIPTTLRAEDEAWIAAGEYTTAQITVNADVKIYGGFAGTETSVDQRVVGNKPWEFTNASVLKNSASLILSITGANVIVDGITFEGTSVAGRAIQNTSAAGVDVIIRNNIIKNFTSGADGGGMNIRYKTEIYNCLITGNTGNKGGGAYLDKVTIHDCEITNNSVPLTAQNSIGNVNGGGGGLLLVESEAYNLFISDNVASFGGGLFPRTTSKVYNSIIVNNTAISGGGISFDERDSGTQIYNVTIANNKASQQSKIGGVNFAANGDARSAKLYNSILWNNTDIQGDVYNIGMSGSADAIPEIKNVIIDDLEFYATEMNPNLVIVNGIAETESVNLFENTTDWVTSANSPGVNKGIYTLTEEITDPDTGEVIPASTLLFSTGKDYAGGERIFETIDIGPFEVQNPNSVPTTNAIEGNVIGVKFYNLQGVEVVKPQETGVYIKKEILDTNKVRTTKVMLINKDR